MPDQIHAALNKLIEQYPKLNYTKHAIPNIKEPVFEMPTPVFPHKRGNIILSAHGAIKHCEPYHRHNYFLINYPYYGDYQACINDENITLHQGEVYFSQPFVAHALFSHANPDDILLSVRIRKELIFHSLIPLLPKNEIFLDFFLSPLNRNATDASNYLILSGDNHLNTSIRSVFDTLILEYVDMLPEYDTLLDSALVMLFSLLSRCYSSEHLHYSNKQSDVLIDNILKYISLTCATATLKAVANEFSYHPNYLSTLLQKETGKTFSELVREYRLQRACVLLQNSELPIEEIGILVGYPHSSNFYKTFKKEYSVSPHQYRLQFTQTVI